ncbi:MAG: sigma-70 family RNA polymerase sigma factor [Prevotellaceae bacterium]|jgi:RNA polymerase sigma-70 factor (ECF subfamily)|nr:sigma-70 family RNA polymerase sigma factor [Prevotellaceae bacterium]
MNAAEFKRKFLPISRKLYVVAFRLLENRQDAEDAVQEAFTKLWIKRAKLHQIANNEAFAMVVLRNICLDILKAKKVKFTDFDENLPESQSSSAEMETREKALIVRKLIDRLPDTQCRIIKMKHWDNFSNDEISHATGISEGNVRVILSRARKTLREQFLKIENF